MAMECLFVLFQSVRVRLVCCILHSYNKDESLESRHLLLML